MVVVTVGPSSVITSLNELSGHINLELALKDGEAWEAENLELEHGGDLLLKSNQYYPIFRLYE